MGYRISPYGGPSEATKRPLGFFESFLKLVVRGDSGNTAKWQHSWIAALRLLLNKLLLLHCHSCSWFIIDRA